MRWLDSTTDSMGMHLSKLQATVVCYSPWGHRESGRAERWKKQQTCIRKKVRIGKNKDERKNIWPEGLAATAKSFQSCPTLSDPRDGSPPGSPLPGILQASTLEWVTISPMHESEKWKWSHSFLTLSDPMDCSPPGSSVHRIFQSRVLEWGTVAFSDFLYSRSININL